MNWTRDRVETLAKLWADGLPTSQIAARLGGVTRNAVIGKAQRLGLASRKDGRWKATHKAQPLDRKWRSPKPIAKPMIAKPMIAKPMPLPAPRPSPPPTPPPLQDAPLPRAHPTLLELAHSSCRWPIARDEDEDCWLFCGKQRHSADVSYCREHWMASTQPRMRMVKPPSAQWGSAP